MKFPDSTVALVLTAALPIDLVSAGKSSDGDVIDFECLNVGGVVDSDFESCNLSPPNESVLGVIDMAAFFNSGTAAAAGFIRPNIPIFAPNSISNTAINFGAGGSCFVTTAEVLYTEFVLAGAVLAGANVDSLVNSVRDYVLCDQTFVVSTFEADTLQTRVPGTDYVLPIFNPNFKVSCTSCVIELATAPTNTGTTLVTAPTDEEELPPDLAGFKVNSSGFIMDGVTFKPADNTEEGLAYIGLTTLQEGLPIQLRNIVIKDTYGFTHGIFVREESPDGLPPKIEISNLLVKDSSFRAPVVYYENGDSECGCFKEDILFGEATLCIKDSKFENLELDVDFDTEENGFVPVAAAIFTTDKDVELGISDVCGENLSSPNDKLYLAKQKNLYSKSAKAAKAAKSSKGERRLHDTPSIRGDMKNTSKRRIFA